ncbi:5'/3'-nucleotidase SurE [Salinarchaeum chitinilyticum]
MDEPPEILLTNDDGIDAPGLAALEAGLSAVADVTVVAPATDQSKVGRQTSTDVVIERHNGGVALTGTPADCVIAGLQEFCTDPDLVVSGCNRGANLGGYVLGRSGTVSAAVEAAFHGVPAIASSLYVPVDDAAFEDAEVEERDFREAVRATRFLVEHALDAGVFEHADYLNVNAPVPDGRLAATASGDAEGETGAGDGTAVSGAPAQMRVTSPSHRYEMDAVREGDRVRLEDRIWELMAEGDLEELPGTDRHAILDGAVSVSPLTAPHTTEHHDALDGLAEAYPTDE